MDNPVGWKDKYNKDCDEYRTYDKCGGDKTWPSKWPYNNQVNSPPHAYDACCGCGGGISCKYEPHDWADDYGYTCPDYSYYQECGGSEVWNDAEWGTIEQQVANGPNALEACCICGGGSASSTPTANPTDFPTLSPTIPTSSPTDHPTLSPSTSGPTIPIPLPTKSPTTPPTIYSSPPTPLPTPPDCHDTPGWADSVGYGCSLYRDFYKECGGNQYLSIDASDATNYRQAYIHCCGCEAGGKTNEDAFKEIKSQIESAPTNGDLVEIEIKHSLWWTSELHIGPGKNVKLVGVGNPSPRLSVRGGENKHFTVDIDGKFSAVNIEFTWGSTEKSGYSLEGGSLLVYGQIPLLLNCTFTENIAYQMGGAISVYKGGSIDLIQNCVFKDNKAGEEGDLFAGYQVRIFCPLGTQPPCSQTAN